MSQTDQKPGPSTPQANSQDRNRYQSPLPPLSSTFTPPPSSSKEPQPAQPVYTRPRTRTPTPTHSHLSSPPPTIRTPPPRRQRAASDSDKPLELFDDLDDRSSEHDLRMMLAKTKADCRNASASAAHFRLQYELLTMEHTEAIKRFQVELDMANKEVEVLQHASPQSAIKSDSPTSLATTTPPASNLVILDLQNHIHMLDSENESLRLRLADAKTIILERENVMSAENERLRRRIRENREHLNLLRQGNAYFGEQLPPSSSQHHHNLNTHYTPSRSRQYGTPATKTPGQDEPFAALLLADQVLSQEAASTPATPVSSQHRRQKASHARGSHSIGSLPSTPLRSAPIDSTLKTSTPYNKRPAYMPVSSSSAAFYSTPVPRQNHNLQQDHRQRRRDSRDSTISASDIDQRYRDNEPDCVLDSEPEDSSNLHGQEPYSSQASQEAANMLRKSSSFSRYQSSGSKERSAASSAPAKQIQSKLHKYQVNKPSATPESLKKRYHEGDEASPGKKARLAAVGSAAEGVGLGIGGWTGR